VIRGAYREDSSIAIMTRKKKRSRSISSLICSWFYLAGKREKRNSLDLFNWRCFGYIWRCKTSQFHGRPCYMHGDEASSLLRWAFFFFFFFCFFFFFLFSFFLVNTNKIEGLQMRSFSLLILIKLKCFQIWGW
jgi:hypothetical protein